MRAQSDLAGRLAIVTGGAGDLGRAIISALLEIGAIVIAWDVDAAGLQRLEATLSGVAASTLVDITDAAAVEAAALSAERDHGPIAILVNNAGILGPVAPTWQIESAAFRRVIDVNLTGAFHCCRAVAPLMIASGVAGRIVNMASTQAKEGTALASAYAASKAGLIALTKTLGKELAPHGILVNAVAPTAVDGAMAESLSAERRADLLSRIPLGRFVTAAEVAAQVRWLCSPECSFATGAVFDMSGGRATW